VGSTCNVKKGRVRNGGVGKNISGGEGGRGNHR